MNIQSTLEHIHYLFECIKSKELDLKPKFSVIGAFESMLILYRYQENNVHSLNDNIIKILQNILQFINDSSQSPSPDSMKSCFMLTESMFSLMDPAINQHTVRICVERLYQSIIQIMVQLNTDILALNNVLREDQL